MGLLTRALPVLLLLAACQPNRTFVPKSAYSADAGLPLCVPNLDGQIDDSEVKAALGIPESLLVSPQGVQRTVNLDGTIDAQGHRVWDLGDDYADDEIARPEAQPVSSFWFASSYPTGQFATALDAAGTLQGIYQDDGSNLLLLGIASTLEAPPQGKTLLVYSTPAEVFRYPLTVGKSWVTVAQTSNGTIDGLPYAGKDTYEIAVDQSGQLILPDLTFTQALRVRTHLTSEPVVGASVSRRQVSWLFECFGEVARATSVDGEPNDDFTTTSELRRLGLQ